MAARMSDEQLDTLERRLSSDNQGDASELADEARRARESEAALLDALKAVAFTLNSDGAPVCRRCWGLSEEHSPDICEVAAALAQSEGK